MTGTNEKLTRRQGIQITKPDSRITFSEGGIQIQSEGKPISFEAPKTGYVYLLIDCSGSMAGDKLDQAKKGAIDFAKDAQRKNYNTGLISFESFVSHICEPQDNYTKLTSYIERITDGGSTNMADAISLATQKLESKKSRKVIVLVTDGMPDSELLTLEAASKAKAKKIEIITIGIEADEAFLKMLASTDKLSVSTKPKNIAKAIRSTAQMLPTTTNKALPDNSDK